MAAMMPRRYGVLSAQGYAKVITNQVYFLPKPIVQGEVDAVIMAVHNYAISDLTSLLRSEPNFGHRPTISLIEKVEGVSSVTADDYQGGAMAITHLLELGHRTTTSRRLTPD